jgi:Cd(II)/Pb(II)-responsive transcriptional regulator
MKIGELARTTGAQVETIRYYEREGLLPPPGRTEGNYRAYDASHVRRLAFICRCRSLDISLEEIRVLLRSWDLPEEDCREVNALLDEHIGHVAERIRELRLLERELRGLRELCARPRDAAHCAILAELALTAPSAPAGRGVRGGREGRHVPGAHPHPREAIGEKARKR